MEDSNFTNRGKTIDAEVTSQPRNCDLKQRFPFSSHNTRYGVGDPVEESLSKKNNARYKLKWGGQILINNILL